MARRLCHLLLVVMLLAPLAGRTAPLQHLAGQTMGTTWSVSLDASDERLPDLRAGVQARLDEVVTQMSTWEPDSDLSRYNRAPGGSWHALPPEAMQVVTAALELAQESAGAFDPTVGPLVAAWGFGPDGPRSASPNPALLSQARERVGWQRLELSPDGELWQPGGASLDLSAIAKGYGVDRVAEWLLAEGFDSFLVEVGGELRGHGRKHDGNPWRVAVERPAPDDSRSDDVQVVVRLDGLAIATSGNYRRQRELDGLTATHIIDPRTGAPVESALAAVTVLHPQAMQADGLATALQVLGPREGRAWADARGLAALLVWQEGDVFTSVMTDAFAAHVEQP